MIRSISRGNPWWDTRFLGCLALSVVVAWSFGTDSAVAATYYWNTTTTGTWDTGANWSNNATSGGTTGVVPSDTDSAVFNQSTVNGNETIQLATDQGILGITFNNTGTTLIQSDSATPRTLTLGTGGLVVNSLAGAVTLGDSTNVVNVSLNATQTWTNNSTSSLSIVNGVSLANAGVQTLTVAGSGNFNLNGIVGDGNGTLSLTKNGTGTLTLANANTYTGLTQINEGTLNVDANAGSGSLSSSSNLTFGGTGGTFDYKGASSGSSLSAGNLTFSAGAGTVQSTYGTSGNTSLTFASLQARTAGAVGNFVASGGANGSTNKIVLTGQATGFIDKGIYFNSGDYASYDSTGYVRALNYTTDANTANRTSSAATLGTVSGNTHVRLAANITGQTTASVGDIKFDGARSLTLGNGTTLTINGILVSGTTSGTPATILGAGASNTANYHVLDLTGGLTIRTATSADYLNLAAGGTNPRWITLNGTGELTFSGAGLVNFRLMANNASGGIKVLGGQVLLNNTVADSLGTNNLTINGGLVQVYTANGLTRALGTGASQVQITGGVSGFSGAGLVSFTSNATEVVWGNATFNPSRFVLGLTSTLGNNLDLNGSDRIVEGIAGGTGTMAGVIRSTTGTAGLTKTGGGTISLTNAASTYNGTTTVNSGILDVTTFANVNTNSSIGKGSAAGSAADLVINGGTLMHSAANVATTTRLFSIGTSGGTIDSSAGNATNSLSFTGTGAMGFNSQLGTRTLALGGSNTGNNTLAVAIGDDGSSNATSISKTGAGLWILTGTNSYTGTTTGTAGALVATTTASLPGYNSAGKVVFNGGTIGGRVGGGGWTTAQIDTLLTNATKTSGSVGVDTTNGDVSQWANLTPSNLGALGIGKLGSNTLTLNQSGIYTGGLNMFAGNVVLDNTTFTTTALQFSTGATGTAITGGTLALAGGNITRTNKTIGVVDTITSAITGSPNVSFATSTATDYRGGLYFAPGPNTTQAVGTVTLSPINGGTDKAGLEIGGVTVGNTLAAVANSSAAYGTFRKRGPSEWTIGGNVSFGAFQNYAGTTVAQGLINSSYQGTQVFGGTFVLDYTSSNTNRLTDNQVLFLNGGTLQLDRSSGATGNHTEVTGNVTLGGGWASVTRGAGSSTKLRMNTITRSVGATIDFGASGIADTDTANTNGILGAWATIAGTDFAFNSSNGTDGTINAYSAYTNVDRLTPGTITDNSTSNVRLVEGSGSPGDIVLGSATTTINTLNQSTFNGTGAATIDTASKILAVNGILAGAGTGGLTIGTAVNSGTLQAGAAGGELIVHNYSSNPMTINSVIANNTSASRLTVTGTGTTILAGTNTYNGTTRISGGVVQAAIGTGFSANTYLQLDGGVLQSSGSFTRANLITAGGGNFQWSSETGGGFAAKGAKLTVTVNNNASTEQTWAWVADVATTALATGNNTILGPLKFGSSTADAEVEFRNNINLNGESREIFVASGLGGDFATLSGVIRNSPAYATAAPAGIYKSGAGILVLSGNNTYNGMTYVTAGTLRGAASSNGASFGVGSAVVLADVAGALLDLNGSNQTIGSLAGGGSTGGNVTLGSGTLTVGNILNTTYAGTISGVGGSLVKQGSGILTLTGNSTYTGATTVTAGTLVVTGSLASSGVTNNTAMVFDSGSAQTYGNSITGNGTLTKTGTGRLNLTGNNTYLGLTTVSQGTLAVNGSIGSGLFVAAGATIGGSGTINGDSVIQGIHSPGNSPGIITHNGTLTYSGGNASVTWELIQDTDDNTGGPFFDQILVTGNLSFADPTALNLVFNGANSTVSWNGTFWDTSRSWMLHDVAGTTSGFGNFTLTSIDWLDSGNQTFSSVRPTSSFNVSQSGQDILINYVAVPEPAAIALLGSAVVMLGFRLAWRRGRTV